jgi:hypothetical protein
MPTIEGTGKAGNPLGTGRVRVARGNYDFAVQGGAVSSITLTGDSIPSGAILLDSVINVETVLTSGGSATVAINTEAAGDIQTAAAYSGTPWSTATAKRGTLTATSAPVKTTAARNIVATIATAALTAGKFQVLIRYIELA